MTPTDLEKVKVIELAKLVNLTTHLYLPMKGLTGCGVPVSQAWTITSGQWNGVTCAHCMKGTAR